MGGLMGNGWFGVDLDGTLAEYHSKPQEEWRPDDIGKPIPAMVERVKAWLAEGRDVRIVTARVGPGNDPAVTTPPIKLWCLQHLGRVLPVIAAKDSNMIELWDDRAVQVETNTGRILGRAGVH
jgi:hypothetical protein